MPLKLPVLLDSMAADCSWLRLAVTILCLQILLAAASSELRNPSKAITTVSDPTIHTPNHRIFAYSTFRLSFTIYNQQTIKLDLEPNHDILQPDAHVQYLDHEGNIAYAEPIDRLQHKVYLGNVLTRGFDGTYSRVGHARILVHQDGPDPVFEGSFDIHRNFHHIQLNEHYTQTKHPNDPASDSSDRMVLWRDSDLRPTIHAHSEFKKRSFAAHDHVSGSCMADQLDFNMDLQHPVYAAMPGKLSSADSWIGPVLNRFGKRQIDSGTGAGNSAGVNLASTIGNPTGCPSTRKVALVGVATDCTYTAVFANNSAVQSNVINIMNSASSVYESTFNISLGLQNITISPSECPGSVLSATPWNQPCTSNLQIQDRLNLFSGWRSQQVDSNSHWTLLSTCATGTAVGLAWLGQACVTNTDSRNSTSGEQQTVAGANVVVRTSGASEWQILAHETGHTFGAVHDCTAQTCSDGTVTMQQCCPLSASTCDAGEKYIMNPSTAEGITNFSPCTLGNICSAFGRQSVKTGCFSLNKGVPLISNAVCGNGIVEAGEQCDCGGSDLCETDGCCDGTTCTFKAGAVCDPTNDECCQNCQLASQGTVCRVSTGVCDPQEVCSGSNATCPPDVNLPNGQGCGSGLTCASGQCTSRDAQCKSLMGPYLTSGSDNTTWACDDETCVLSCASPEFGPDTCYGLQQNFLDGTTCGGGGQCLNGVCKGSNFGKEIKNWLDEHRTIVIIVGTIVGILVLLAVIGCLYRCCAGRNGRCGSRRRVETAAYAWPGDRKYTAQTTPSTSGFYAQSQQQWAPQSSSSYSGLQMPHPPTQQQGLDRPVWR